MTLSTPARVATSLFEASFSSHPAAGASAPGRVNLLGEHTDYNGGPVLPLALERRTAVVVGRASRWEAVSTLDTQVRDLDPEGPMCQGWTDYLAGVVRVLQRRGAAPRGARVAVASNLPVGAGLSSSASLTVAAAKALSLLAGHRLDATELADIAFLAEHDEVGVHCGRMDQTIGALARPGTVLLYEAGDGSIRLLPLAAKVWLLETGVSHRLSGGALNARRRECQEALALCRDRGLLIRHLAEVDPALLPAVLGMLPPPLVSRVRHVVMETARVRSAVEALLRKDLPALGALLLKGHASLRHDYESSCIEADVLVDSAAARGAYGARLTGAGWGGAVVMLAPVEREARIIAEIQEDFRRAFGRIPTIWSSRPSKGARWENVAPRPQAP